MEWLLRLRLKYVLLVVVLLVLLLSSSIYFMIEDVEDELEVKPNEVSHETHEVVATYERSENYEEDSIFDEYQEISSEGVDERWRVLDDGSYHDFSVDRVISPIVNALKHAEDKELPLIIWWTPFTPDNGVLKRCWVGDCYFSKDRSLYNHTLTKAFLFYGTEFNYSDLPLPRGKHHEWGLLHEESPKNVAMFLYKDTIEIFNHTSTFRKESDYPITTQYVISASYLLKRPKYSVIEKNQLKIEEKIASVVYIQSGCNPPSDRDAYIQELRKYIAIDCYGKCLHNKDLPPKYVDPLTMFNKGFVEIIEKYKFIISFENGICRDYVTEKLYRTLHVGAIPIYKGAPNVEDWLPSNHSAIIADNFETPKHLADYINFVDHNDDEYKKYLGYKDTGITNVLLNETLKVRQWGVDTIYKMSFVVGFECHVCDQIHKNRQLIAAGELPLQHRATFKHYGCPAPKKYNLPKVTDTEEWERDMWGWEYEQAGMKVEKLRKSLESNL